MKSIIFNIMIMSAFFVLFTYYPNTSQIFNSTQEIVANIADKETTVNHDMVESTAQQPQQPVEEPKLAKAPVAQPKIADDIVNNGVIEENIATLDAQVIDENTPTQEVALFDPSSQQQAQQSLRPQFMSNQDRAVELHNLAQEMEFIFIDRVQ